jgi:hypothetical protein
MRMAISPTLRKLSSTGLFVLTLWLLCFARYSAAEEAIGAKPNSTPATEWSVLTGADKLKEFMSGLVAEWVWPDGRTSRAEYFADGTGVLFQYGVKFPRRWEVHGEDQICFITIKEIDCHTIERNLQNPDLYRIFDADENEWVQFSVVDGLSVEVSPPPRKRTKAGAAAASAAEVAAELTDPNTTLGILATLYDYQVFDGSAPDASKQTAQVITFQPSLPYPLEPGRNLFFRPAIPLILSQPVWDSTTGTFQSEGMALGDIGYDATMGFSFNVEGGRNSILLGVAGSIPTATDDALASDQWLLGPEIGFTAIREWGSLGGILYRQFDVAGADSYDTDVTGGQYVYNINLGKGWQITGSPTFSYDNKADSGNAFTFPLAVGVAKTSIIYGRPWMFSAEYWHYIESPDIFGPKNQIRLSVAPIVPLPW